MDICREPFLLNCLHYNHRLRLWRPNSKNTNWKNCDHYLCTYRFSPNGYLFKKQWDSNGKLFSIYLLEMLQMLLWYFNFSKAYLRIFWIVDRNFYLCLVLLQVPKCSWLVQFFCARPKICLHMYCGSHKHFVPEKKMICIQ